MLTPWEGRTQLGRVIFDWDSMTPTLTFAEKGQWGAVRRNGEVRILEREEGQEGAQGNAPMGEALELTVTRQTAVTRGYCRVGTIDSRMLASLEKLRDPNYAGGTLMPEETVGKLSRALKTEGITDQLHWRTADDLRDVQGATQFIGADLRNAHPGYTTLVSPQPHKQSMGFSKEIGTETTVAWLEGLGRSEWETTLDELEKNQIRSILVLYKSSREAARPKERGWRLLTYYPAGALKMASGKAPILLPSRSKERIEVWVRGTCNGTDAEERERLDAKEEAATRLDDLQERKGGRWGAFLQASQEYEHLGTQGTLVATDGSVRMTENGPITGAGVAFRKGDCPEGDIVRVIFGAPTSFGAEGGAVETALDVTDRAKDLTVLTDSANIMFALQHCSRNDWWRDFDNHKDRDMLERLATKLAARTAQTTFVKVKAHASVPLNDRADELAGMAGRDEEALQGGVRELPPWPTSNRRTPT